MIGGVLWEFLAMLVGFMVMAGLVSSVSATLPRLKPNWVELDGTPRRPLITANLSWSFFSAMAGGYVTAYIAKENPLDTAVALGIVILVLGGIWTLQSREKYPVWYLLLLLVFTPGGIIAGGFIRMQMMVLR